MAKGSLGDGLRQAKNFLAGQRTLPDKHVVKYLTRLNLYAPLLQMGVRPDVIELLLQRPNELADIVERTAKAYMDIPDETEAYAAAMRTFGSSLATRGITRDAKGGFSAGAGASGAVGLLAWVAGAAWGAAGDCVDGVTQQWLKTHRSTMADKLNAIKPYFHDGMDYVRDGKPKDEGVSLVGAPLNVPAGQVEIRRRSVKIVFDWLMSHKDLQNSSLLTIFPKIVCMCDNVLNQWDTKAKMEAGSVFYASIVEMAEVMTKVMHDVGWLEAAKAYCAIGSFTGTSTYPKCELSPHPRFAGLWICNMPVIVIESGKGKKKFYPCGSFVDEMLRAAKLRGPTKETDVTKQYASWHIYLRGLNVETLVYAVQFFTVLAFSRRISGTTEDLYYGTGAGTDKQINPIWNAQGYREAHPELVSATAGYATKWTFPVLNLVMVNQNLLETVRKFAGMTRRVASTTEDQDAADYLAQHTASVEAQIRDRAIKRRNKIITWTLGGVAVVAIGGVIYVLLKDR